MREEWGYYFCAYARRGVQRMIRVEAQSRKDAERMADEYFYGAKRLDEGNILIVHERDLETYMGADG